MLLEPILITIKKFGLNGLTIGHSSGVPRLLNDEQEKERIQTITHSEPDEVAFIARKNWTIELIRQWGINAFQCHFQS